MSCVTSSTKREIRYFHVVVVQRRQRNVHKVCCMYKVVIFSIVFFAVLIAVAVVVAYAPYYWDKTKGWDRLSGNLYCFKVNFEVRVA